MTFGAERFRGSVFALQIAPPGDVSGKLWQTRPWASGNSSTVFQVPRGTAGSGALAEAARQPATRRGTARGFVVDRLKKIAALQATRRPNTDYP